MNPRIIRLLSVLAIMVISVVVASAETISEKEDTKGILADSAVVDLGNHKVAYLTGSYELEKNYGYKEWIAIQKLDKGKELYSSKWDTLFISVEGGVIAIEAIDDFTGLRITEKTEQGIRERQIPVCFFPEEDFIDYYQFCSRVIPSVESENSLLPAEVWREMIGSGEEKYEIVLEKISASYKLVSDFMTGDFADYRMIVRDVGGRAVQKLILTGVNVSLEEIHWLIDIDGDGSRDLIFCADHVVGQRDSSTKLVFLIWNSEKKRYEEKPFMQTYANDSYVDDPIWNTEERALMFATEKCGNHWVRGHEMYRFADGDWQLYARLIPSSDEEAPCMDGYEAEVYYKNLDYYYVEKRYESGKVIGETVMEEAPYSNKQSMWYEEGEGNQELFP